VHLRRRQPFKYPFTRRKPLEQRRGARPLWAGFGARYQGTLGTPSGGYLHWSYGENAQGRIRSSNGESTDWTDARGATKGSAIRNEDSYSPPFVASSVKAKEARLCGVCLKNFRPMTDAQWMVVKYEHDTMSLRHRRQQFGG